jgi:hypothetical protein
MMHTLVTHVIAFLLGSGGGAWAWNKYAAKAASDLAAVKAKL